MDSSDIGSSNKGSSETGSPGEARAEAGVSSAAAPATDAAAPSAAAANPAAASAAASEPAGADAPAAAGAAAAPSLSDSTVTSGRDQAGNSAAAKPRPGSSLILIPPVTRKSDGAQASPPPPPGNDSASGPTASTAGFAADRRPKRRARGGFLRYAAPAVLALVLFGAGLAAGGQFSGKALLSAAFPGMGGPKATQAAYDPSELRRLNKKLSDEIHALQTRVDSLRVTAQAASPDDMGSVKKSLDGLRASLDAVKAETGTQIVQLNARIDHLQHEARPQSPTEKHVEHSAAALPNGSATRLGPPALTAATAHAGAPHAGEVQTAVAGSQVPKEQSRPGAPEAKHRPQQLLVDWVVRDVYHGMALVDGPEGTIEVARGDVIPGAGTVEAIERRNGGWVLITSRGIVESLRD